MLLINDCFQTHVFDHRLQGFLLMLKRKAVHAKLTGKGCRTAVLDELYGASRRHSRSSGTWLPTKSTTVPSKSGGWPASWS